MKRVLIPFFLVAIFAAAVLPAKAQDKNGYDRIVSHLKTRYHAKKVKIPFLWLARLAVGVVRPAGVKSFSFTVFKDLRFSIDEVDKDMQVAMRDSFGPEWIPALRVRSKNGPQAYMYIREDGDRMRMALVTIDKEQATIIRATFSPDRLTEFINDPKILGIRLNDEKIPEAPEQARQPDTADPAHVREVSN